MKVLHISAECYPAAKAGGLGDVAGALPKYQTHSGYPAAVIIPKYHNQWILSQQWHTCLEGTFLLGNERIQYAIHELVSDELGFPLYVAHIPGKFDRPNVYLDEEGNGYRDETERSIAFQIAALHWVNDLTNPPEIIHCHDHHTGLVPFMVKYCPDFQRLANIPTIFTIHNAAYHGTFGWEKSNLLPVYDLRRDGLLDWNEAINPLAAAIKCCWRLTTVSPGYMTELPNSAGTLATLLENETEKSQGILNGIDVQVWNPQTDPFVAYNLKKSLATFKKKNKKWLTDHYNLLDNLPLITFIGRLAGEKGAHLLSPVIRHFLEDGKVANFIVLGTGNPEIQRDLSVLDEEFKQYVTVILAYDEQLAHQLYAGSDFLIMPSKVEPCGLNQMYAMRYGTVPIVRATGGLKDTVPDMARDQGRGFQFNDLDADEAVHALHRAIRFYDKKKEFARVRQRISKIDFSWESSARQYLSLYQSVKDEVLD